MRTIKFRALVTKNSDEGDRRFLLPVSTIYLDNTASDGELDIIANSLRWDTNISMQFTGEKDKNGQEIYEDDIIKVSLPNSKTRVVNVVYRGSCFVLADDGVPLDVVTNFEGVNCVEVIGNIHENPELID